MGNICGRSLRKMNEVTSVALVALLLIKSSGTHWTEVWVGPRPVCKRMEKRQSVTSAEVRTPDRSAHSDSQCSLRYLSSPGQSDKLTEQDVDGSSCSNVKHHAENCPNKIGNTQNDPSYRITPLGPAIQAAVLTPNDCDEWYTRAPCVCRCFTLLRFLPSAFCLYLICQTMLRLIRN